MTYVIKDRSSGEILASGIPGEDVIVMEGNWYFAPEVVKQDYLRVTDRSYTCPYKGVCYWIDLKSPTTRAQNIAWVYEDPKAGYSAIKGYIAFYSQNTQGTLAAEIKDDSRETVPASR